MDQNPDSVPNMGAYTGPQYSYTLNGQEGIEADFETPSHLTPAQHSSPLGYELPSNHTRYQQNTGIIDQQHLVISPIQPYVQENPPSPTTLQVPNWQYCNNLYEHRGNVNPLDACSSSSISVSSFTSDSWAGSQSPQLNSSFYDDITSEALQALMDGLNQTQSNESVEGQGTKRSSECLHNEDEDTGASASKLRKVGLSKIIEASTEQLEWLEDILARWEKAAHTPNQSDIEHVAGLVGVPLVDVALWYGKRLEVSAEQAGPAPAPTPAPDPIEAVDHQVQQDIARYINKLRNAGRCRKSQSQKSKGGRYRCTYGCGYSTNKRDDWKRHEEKRQPQDFWHCLNCRTGRAESGRRKPFIVSRGDKFPAHARKCSPSDNAKNLMRRSKVPYVAPFSPTCTYVYPTTGVSCFHFFRNWQERNDHYIQHYEAEEQPEPKSEDHSRHDSSDEGDSDDDDDNDGSPKRHRKHHYLQTTAVERIKPTQAIQDNQQSTNTPVYRISGNTASMEPVKTGLRAVSPYPTWQEWASSLHDVGAQSLSNKLACYQRTYHLENMVTSWLAGVHAHSSKPTVDLDRCLRTSTSLSCPFLAHTNNARFPLLKTPSNAVYDPIVSNSMRKRSNVPNRGMRKHRTSKSHSCNDTKGSDLTTSSPTWNFLPACFIIDLSWKTEICLIFGKFVLESDGAMCSIMILQCEPAESNAQVQCTSRIWSKTRMDLRSCCDGKVIDMSGSPDV